MKITYFEDTDTAVFEFTDGPAHETREINEDVYVDLDETGALVSMTIEHAGSRASLPSLAIEHVSGAPS